MKKSDLIQVFLIVLLIIVVLLIMLAIFSPPLVGIQPSNMIHEL